MSVEVITFGCRLNTVESAAMRAMAAAGGHDKLAIVNSCAVTAEAVRQARQTIRRLKRDDPQRRLVVTGCAAQTEPERFAGMAEVDAIVGNGQKLAPETWASGGLRTHATTGGAVGVADGLPQTVHPDAIEGHARAFVQVQNGCDHRCTFCIIPFGRGASRSVPVDDAVAQVGRHVAVGYREIVLTGVDLTSYGADLPGGPRLGNLVGAVLAANPGLARLRLSSIDSIEVDATLLALLKTERRLMPHLHLSLQSGDDLILKRMKRRHSRRDAIRFCAELRAARPEFVFGADLIAGFPTETEAHHQNSLRLIEECGLSFLHVFPYSPRPGTPAARMPAVDAPTIKRRAAELRAAGAAALARHLADRVGREAEILIERGSLGRLEDFTPVRFSGQPAPGSLARVAITGHDGVALRGMLVSASGDAAAAA